MKTQKKDIRFEIKEKIKKKILAEIDTTSRMSDDELKDFIKETVVGEICEKSVSLKEKLEISRELFNSVRGLDILEDLLKDEEITEIMINDYRHIFIEKKGKLFRYEGEFMSEEKLKDVIQNIVAKSNKRVNEATPIADTRLADGSRVNVVLDPISIKGPAVTIRKFSEKAMTAYDLIALETMSPEVSELLKKMVEEKLNIFISGGTGSGKTTLLNVLSNFIPSDERVVTIEDSAELKIRSIENLVSLECRQANVEGENEITIRDLIRTSLRMRPDRIVVGEVRGKEAVDMLQAMNTGHAGSLSTGHANSAADMLTRLETMVLMGEDIPLAAIKKQIASALDVIIHLKRMPDGSRKVAEIARVGGIADGEIELHPIYTYKELTNDSDLTPPSNAFLVRN